MIIRGRSIVSIDDLSNEEIEELFLLANRIREAPYLFSNRANAKVLATLFFEPSTRTRLSFESAVQRLGGHVISDHDMTSSSATKGETLADACRVVGTYADAIVLRHPWEGAAQAASDVAGVPVINAGDGGHEHPTQTLCDLYTMWLKHGHLEGLKVALCGDLKYGRTIHSLIYGLTRFRANVILLPGANLELPDYVKRKLQVDYDAVLTPVADPGGLARLYPNGSEDPAINGRVDVIYMTPTKPHQPSLFTDGHEGMRIDANGVHLYITRAQNERLEDGEQGRKESYPRVTKEVLAHPEFRNTSIMHPLPRVDEISRELDSDPRSMYFDQAGNGVPIRMALLLALLGLDPISVTDFSPPETTYVTHDNRKGSNCQNTKCVSQKEEGTPQHFSIIPYGLDGTYLLRCLYCELDFPAAVYGNTLSHIYHPSDQLFKEQPVPEHVAFFRSQTEAESAGFEAVADGTRRAPKRERFWPPLASPARRPG